MTNDARFWDDAAAKYAASPVKDQQTYEYTLAETRKHLSTDDHILEVGCGTGSTALLLADAVATLTASDISGEMIRIAQEKAKVKDVTNVDFVQATPSDPKLRSRSYDAVLGFNILHLLDDLPRDLKGLHDRLKPGGLLISKTPCLGDWKYRFFARAAIPVMQFFGKAPYVSFLTGGELEAAIIAAGFEIAEADNHNTFSRFIVAKKR